MRKTFKYRLYPTRAQRTAMRKTLDACCWVYNEVLATRKNAWEQKGRSVSHYETINMLPEWKTTYLFLNNAYSQSLQDVCTRVNLAFQAFFRRVRAGLKDNVEVFRPGESRMASGDECRAYLKDNAQIWEMGDAEAVGGK